MEPDKRRVPVGICNTNHFTNRVPDCKFAITSASLLGLGAGFKFHF